MPQKTKEQTPSPQKEGRKIGYCRVSTAEQNLELQINALEAAGCTRIFKDQGVSGNQKSREGFDAAMACLERGDTLMIWRLDRMGRSLKHLIEINEELTERGVYLESLMEKIDTATAMGEFVFHILGAVAQLERQIIRERTLAGLEAAAKKGRFPGRPRTHAKRRYSFSNLFHRTMMGAA